MQIHCIQADRDLRADPRTNRNPRTDNERDPVPYTGSSTDTPEYGDPIPTPTPSPSLNRLGPTPIAWYQTMTTGVGNGTWR